MTGAARSGTQIPMMIGEGGGKMTAGAEQVVTTTFGVEVLAAPHLSPRMIEDIAEDTESTFPAIILAMSSIAAVAEAPTPPPPKPSSLPPHPKP